MWIYTNTMSTSVVIFRSAYQTFPSNRAGQRGGLARWARLASGLPREHDVSLPRLVFRCLLRRPPPRAVFVRLGWAPCGRRFLRRVAMPATLEATGGLAASTRSQSRASPPQRARSRARVTDNLDEGVDKKFRASPGETAKDATKEEAKKDDGMWDAWAGAAASSSKGKGKGKSKDGAKLNRSCPRTYCRS